MDVSLALDDLPVRLGCNPILLAILPSISARVLRLSVLLLPPKTLGLFTSVPSSRGELASPLLVCELERSLRLLDMLGDEARPLGRLIVSLSGV